jgi:hypothetical protein
MHNAIKQGKTLIAKAQETMQRNANRYRCLVNFGPKDKVYISIKNWKT